MSLTSSATKAPRVTVDKPDYSICHGGFTNLTAGTALQFNPGSNVNISGYSWPTGGPITIEFWTKVKTTEVSHASAFHLGHAETPNRIQAHVPYADKRLYWDYGDIYGAGRIHTDFTNYLDKWTHVALVSAGNGGNFKAIYLDGILKESGTVSDGPDIALNGLLIGSFFNSYHRGMIDEFRI